jgi:hypothetical protein
MEKKDALIVDFRSKGIAAGIPRSIIEALSELLYALVHESEVTIPEHPGIAAAVQAQLSVGLHLLPRGFIVTHWLNLLEEFGVQHPESRMSGLLKRIWLEFTDQIWKNRNEVMHSKESKARQHEEDQLSEKLRWFLANEHVIAPWDRFILEYSVDDIDYMSGFVKRRLVRNLETVQGVYERERKTVEAGQSDIRSFFQRR